MINHDMRAIVFSFLIADISITLFMVLLAAQNRGRLRGIYSWVVAFLLQNIGVILIELRGEVPDWSSIVLSNTMIIAGMLAGLIGMCRFLEVKYSHIPNYFMVLLYAAAQIWFTFGDPDLSARIVNLALAMLILSSQYIWLIFFRVHGHRRKLSAGVGMVYIGYATVNLIRVFNFFISNDDLNDYFYSGTFEKAVFISYQVLFIFLAYSLALMYNRSLYFEIASQEEKYSKAFNSSPYAILMTRYTDGKILEVNKGFTRMTGFSYEEAIGRTTSELQFWITDRDRDTFKMELSGGRIFESKKQFRMRSGEIITTLISAELINVNEEKLIITSINDITPLLQKELLLREKVADLERFNRLMTGRELRIIQLKREINELCERLGMGDRYTTGDLTGHYQSFSEDGLNESTATLNPQEIYEPANYRQEEHLASLNLIEDLSLEIIRRKQAEDNIKESEYKYRRLFESMTHGVFYQMPDGSLNDVNPAGLRLLGLTAEEFLGRTSFHPEWKVLDEKGNVLDPEHYPSVLAQRTGRELTTVVAVYNPAKKDYTWLSVFAQPEFHDGEAEPFRVYVTLNDITETKHALDELKQLSALNEAILKSVPDIIMEVDENKIYTWSNNAGYEFFGDDVIGKEADFYFIGEQDTYKSVEPLFRNMDDFVYVESWQRRKDGESRLLAWRCKAFLDDKRKTRGVLSSASDITELRQYEKATRESEKKFRNLFENSPLGKSITGLDGTLYVNKSFCDMLGYSLEEINNRNWKEFTHPDDIMYNEQVIKMLLDGIHDRYRFEKRYIHRKGHLKWAELSLFLQRDENGEPLYFISTINDITERKKLEIEKFRLLDLIDGSLNEIYIFNTDDLRFEYVNKGALKNLGYSLKEMQKLTPLDIKREMSEKSFKQYLNPLLNGKRKMAIFETVHRRKDGTTYPVEVHMQLYSKNGNNLFFAFGYDITERKIADETIRKLNEELEDRVMLRTAQLEATNKELEAFSYSVSHDLRAPLRAIHSFTSILEKEFEHELGEEGNRICRIIEDSSVRMGTLIDDLLAFSKVGRSRLSYSTINMKATAKKAFEEITSGMERKRITFNVIGLANAKGDASLIRQAVANLISNAVKYSSKNEYPVISITSESRDDEILFSVTDNGVGFNMKYVDKLFNVFQRLHSDREFEGNGVGLAIVHRIITMHGGRVWAESETGKGSTFYFTLPKNKDIT